MSKTNYWARNATQSDFWAHYSVLCQQADKFDRVVEECNRRLSNSSLELELMESRLSCNLSEARMRIEEQTVKHYVPGLNSPFVTRQSVVQAYEDQVQKRIYNDYLPEKNCGNCKHYRFGTSKTGPCDVFAFCWKDKPFESVRECIHNNRKYWSPDKNAARMMGMSSQDCEQDIHEVVENLTDRINQLRCDKIKSEIYDVYTKAMDADKPEKKYTVYDLYDLVFPDDPIKAHFDAERKRIEEKYKPQEEIAEKLEAPEVRRTHPEPIPTVTYDDHPILVDIACALAAVIILSMVVLVLCEIFFIIL